MSNFRINFTDIGNEELNLTQGSVRNIHLDAGLNMRAWNLNFTQSMELSKASVPIHSQFYLLFILTPDTIALTSVDQHLQYNSYRERHAILIPDNVSVQFTVVPNLPVRLIEFNIAAWYMKELLAGKKEGATFSAFWGDPDFKTVYTETGSWQMNTLAGELFQAVYGSNSEPGQLMPGSVALINSFIERSFCTRGNNPREKDMYHSKMEEAEKILMLHLQDKLPNLAQIARQLAISESTLKRHFKVVYGKSIYGYYLARKMDLARQLMDQNSSSVNELAELLGYEKVSYFIEIFKKYHGISPGEILRRRRHA